ncbi:MAG: hypothetical protein AAGE52_10885 [Myxococcota bacterium]
MKRAKKFLARGALTLLIGAALLYIPDCEDEFEGAAEGEPFVWNQDAVWDALAARFARAKTQGCHALSIAIREEIQALGHALDDLETRPPTPGDARLNAYEERFFRTAAEVAACTSYARDLVDVHSRMRTIVKDASADWDLDQRGARGRLYRLLYGGRMAIEEVLLQIDEDAPVLARGQDEPSGAPSTEIRGVRVHSGDILVSRGGAPTSALIARGNDYPGNFSHIALAHVDEDGTFQTIEAHIEVGVVVAGLERYENDPKLRVMLLRPRESLGGVAHAAAEHALSEAKARHIPYDFAMNYEDDAQQFCSEVASSAYRAQNVSLWQGLTSMSSPATARWLHAFGVRNFVTHGPSDLEYDPQLVVVAEWRDADTLFQDHVDSAVIDAMLEGAAAGDEVKHSQAMLPLARLIKAWSVVKNLFGAAGPVPEGMSATVGLRAQWLRENHRRLAAKVRESATLFQEEHGHRPPYWELVRMANEARNTGS